MNIMNKSLRSALSAAMQLKIVNTNVMCQKRLREYDLNSSKVIGQLCQQCTSGQGGVACNDWLCDSQNVWIMYWRNMTMARSTLFLVMFARYHWLIIMFLMHHRTLWLLGFLFWSHTYYNTVLNVLHVTYVCNIYKKSDFGMLKANQTPSSCLIVLHGSDGL